MIVHPLATVSLLVCVLSVPAPAQPAAASEQAAKAGSPDERICENITVTGSRLSKRRICATRAEWAERRREDRETADKFQTLTRNPCNSVNQERGAGNC
jgi:hypothetical protein